MPVVSSTVLRSSSLWMRGSRAVPRRDQVEQLGGRVDEVAGLSCPPARTPTPRRASARGESANSMGTALIVPRLGRRVLRAWAGEAAEAAAVRAKEPSALRKPWPSIA